MKRRIVRDLPPLSEMPDDFNLTLEEACRVFYRGMITPVSLRAARDRGHERAGVLWSR